MTDVLCSTDSYLREFDATVVEADGRFVVLDRTAFYAEGGGQPADTGKIIRGNEAFAVVYVKKLPEKVSHEVNREGLVAGNKVKGIIDWERRHVIMRYHTAAHILSRVVHDKTAALITGKDISRDGDRTRIDFSLEQFDREQIRGFAEKANAVIAQQLPVSIRFVSRAEAEQMPQVTRLNMGLPPVDPVRLISIGDFDVQACGGTHVANTKEIGSIEILKAENKGKSNRRVYFGLR